MPGIRSDQFDPFQHSVLGRPALWRLLIVAGVLAGLWAGIAWAIALP